MLTHPNRGPGGRSVHNNGSGEIVFFSTLEDEGLLTVLLALCLLAN